jgi:aspartyl-tRNA synthetase
MHAYRTHDCAALRAEDEGRTVRLSGWVHAKRDHGGLLFIDLRDHAGITQIVFPSGSALLDQVERIRVESVLTITGQVVLREGATVNPKLPTGAIEVRAAEMAVQSPAAVLPLQVAGNEHYGDELRLTYRYLDLRRERVHQNMMLRAASSRKQGAIWKYRSKPATISSCLNCCGACGSA